jgi:transcriptional regulator with XRE-family HTH domain
MELLKRIDIARAKVGMTRAELARFLGLSPQAISSLGRRPNARLKHENIVKAAHVLHCDLEWLSSGVGPYKPAPTISLVRDIDQSAPLYSQAAELSHELAQEALLLGMFKLLSPLAREDVITYVAGALAAREIKDKSA